MGIKIEEMNIIKREEWRCRESQQEDHKFRQRCDYSCETTCSTIISSFRTVSLRSRAPCGPFFWLPRTSVHARDGLWATQLLVRLAELTARFHHRPVRAARRPCKEPMKITSILPCNTDQTVCAITS